MCILLRIIMICCKARAVLKRWRFAVADDVVIISMPFKLQPRILSNCGLVFNLARAACCMASAAISSQLSEQMHARICR